MALVGYDSSDTSDLDDDDFSNTVIPSENNKKSDTTLTSDLPKEISQDSEASTNCLQNTNLFHTLPKPTQNEITEEQDDEFLHKKETLKREKAKIAIPSLSEFKDVENGPTMKKSNLGSGKMSGLLSILPEPKFSRSSIKKSSKPLIPNVVERKSANINPNPTVKNPNIGNPMKANSSNGKSILNTNYSDSDEDDNEKSYVGKDFFSIHSQHTPVFLEKTAGESVNDQINYHSTRGQSMMENHFNNISAHSADEQSSAKLASNNVSDQCVNDNKGYQCAETIGTDASSSNDLQLDDEAIRQLCGSRKRHRKEDIQLITVDQQQVLSDSREWLLKGLMDDTSKRVSASKRKGNEPTSQQKRKHQITYLAHQAKANEAELQNQWANNRMSKRQTQSKYGF